MSHSKIKKYNNNNITKQPISQKNILNLLKTPNTPKLIKKLNKKLYG